VEVGKLASSLQIIRDFETAANIRNMHRTETDLSEEKWRPCGMVLEKIRKYRGRPVNSYKQDVSTMCLTNYWT